VTIFPDTVGALIKALMHNLDERCGLCGEAVPLTYWVAWGYGDSPVAVCTSCARRVEAEAVQQRGAR
jgi:ribosome-binding protein aMBF1 (putative translation factor)